MESNDDLGTVRWFGESWGAPVNDPRTQIPQPRDCLCIFCVREILAEDQGIQIPMATEVGMGLATYHKHCWFETLGIIAL